MAVCHRHTGRIGWLAAAATVVFSHEGSGLTVALHPDSPGPFLIQRVGGNQVRPPAATLASLLMAAGCRWRVVAGDGGWWRVVLSVLVLLGLLLLLLLVLLVLLPAMLDAHGEFVGTG